MITLRLATLSYFVHQVAAFVHIRILWGRLAMHSHLGPPGSSISPPRECIGNAENGYSHLYNSFQNVPLKGLFWGCWPCILILEHQLAAFLQPMISLGILGTQSRVCQSVSGFHQNNSLKVTATSSKACTLFDISFTGK